MNNEDETLLKFPCRFPIKAMGQSVAGLEKTMIDIVRQHAPDISDADVKTRPSRNDRYISVTVTITATSRAQLDSIYQSLTDHPDVMMAF